ncbi:MAG TPA: hypothetical protein VF941_16315 [Clostridia bacterium]
MKKTADWDYEKELDNELNDKDEIEALANSMSVKEALEIYRKLYTVNSWNRQKMIEVNAAGLKLRRENIERPSEGIYDVKHDSELDLKEAQIRIKGYVLMSRYKGSLEKSNVLLKKFGYPTIKTN